MRQGVIYVATGAAFLDLAVQSARSLRAVEPDLAIDLFTDQGGVPGGLFDAVHGIKGAHSRSKLECMAQSRFERTLFLDCDTLVVGPLGDIWDVLERFDCALAHDVRRASDLIQEGDRHATPYAFPQLNSGVVLYRRSAEMLAFLAEWAARYHGGGFARDQIVLKDLLWESDIRFYVLPPEFNLRRVTVLEAWEPLDARPTILHSHRFKDHLAGGARISDARDLCAAEKRALAVEWDGTDEEDPVGRFAAAQRNPCTDSQ